jgi:hypothetical protein
LIKSFVTWKREIHGNQEPKFHRKALLTQIHFLQELLGDGSMKEGSLGIYEGGSVSGLVEKEDGMIHEAFWVR